MDTNRIRYFCTIAETGSLSRASELLGISHSGLSKALHLLEQELSVKLFQPQGRGLVITNDGKSIYYKCQDVLRALDALKIEKPPGPVKLKIGMPEIMISFASAEIAAEISCAMSFIESNAGQVEDHIIQGEVDFAFGFVPLPKPQIEYLKIGTTRFNAYAKKGIETTNLPFAAPEVQMPSNPLSFENRDGWPSNIERSHFYNASRFAIALNLAKCGLAISYMPDFIARYENERNIEKLAKVRRLQKAQSERDMYLIKLKSTEESTEMKVACKVIRKLLRL